MLCAEQIENWDRKGNPMSRIDQITQMVEEYVEDACNDMYHAAYDEAWDEARNKGYDEGYDDAQANADDLIDEAYNSGWNEALMKLRETVDPVPLVITPNSFNMLRDLTKAYQDDGAMVQMMTVNFISKLIDDERTDNA